MNRRIPANRLASFIGQKGGVGKSSLARLLAVAARTSGRRVLLADFDLEQLTCVEWNATRMRRGVEPELDVRAFKSLKKLRKTEDQFDLVVADTRGLADGLTRDVAEESDVVFLPTGCSADDLRPTLVLAQRLAKHGSVEKLTLILAKVGRSERQIAAAAERIQKEGFDLLGARWAMRDGFQTEFDAGRVGLESKKGFLRQIADEMSRELILRALPDPLPPESHDFEVAAR
jgi:chromosome partitioning protein